MKLKEAFTKKKALSEMERTAGQNGMEDLYIEINERFNELLTKIDDEGRTFSALLNAYTRMKECDNDYICIRDCMFSNIHEFVEILSDNGFTEFVYASKTCSWANELYRLQEHGLTFGNFVMLSGNSYHSNEFGIVVHINKKEEQ